MLNPNSQRTDTSPQATPASLQTVQNTVALANVIELVGNVVSQISVTAVSDALNKDGLSNVVLNNVIANRIKEVLVSAKG